MTDIDVVELLKAIIGLLTVLAPIIVGLFGIWKIVLGYQDKRATAKERDHQMAIELQTANAKRDAENDARQDTQLQQAIDAVKLMATQLTRLMDIMQESQKQEAERIELRRLELAKSHSDFAIISTEMRNQVQAMGELSGNLSDQLGKVALENRNSYQEALDKKVNEEHEQSAALIAELKQKLEKLEGYVEKDMLPILRDLHKSLDTLATKEDITPIKDMAQKIGELESQITTLMKQDTPAPATPSAVVEPNEGGFVPPVADVKLNSTSEKDKPSDTTN